MCHRFEPITKGQAERALASLRSTGRATLAAPEEGPSGGAGLSPAPGAPGPEGAPDAFPGSTVPLFVMGPDGHLQVSELVWGFPGPRGPVINARLETAAEQARRGRGMWAEAARAGRCLVPVRAFYETHGSETARSPITGRDVRRQYRFDFAGRPAFLIAGLAQAGRFSLVTAPPSPVVAPVHDRMPLVLGPGESRVWLGAGWEGLHDRRNVPLEARPEELRG